MGNVNSLFPENLNENNETNNKNKDDKYFKIK